MDNDDQLVGIVLTRRQALKVLGLTGAALAVSCGPRPEAIAETTATATSAGASGLLATPTSGPSGQAPACVVRPAMTEGPYFVDEQILRSDIRSDPASGVLVEGSPLELTVNVSRIDGSGCTPLGGAVVDIWHCDARGAYSDVSDPGFNTVGQKFLRGYQVSDADGRVQFTTIYPGWYQGRTVHIHFKIRSGSYEFTSQWFFDDSFTDQVYTREPYASKGERTLRNSGDGIYQNGGDQLTLDVAEAGTGYTAAFDIGLAM